MKELFCLRSEMDEFVLWLIKMFVFIKLYSYCIYLYILQKPMQFCMGSL